MVGRSVPYHQKEGGGGVNDTSVVVPCKRGGEERGKRKGEVNHPCFCYCKCAATPSPLLLPAVHLR